MLTTPHVLVALVISKIVPNPIVVILLAIISHFILDFFIPHWNPHIYTEMKKKGKISSFSLKFILGDVFIALLSLSVLSLKTWPSYGQVITLALASLAAVMPDLVEAPYYFFGWKNKWLNKYVVFQHKYQSNGNKFWGILTQVLIVLACLKQLFF